MNDTGGMKVKSSGDRIKGFAILGIRRTSNLSQAGVLKERVFASGRSSQVSMERNVGPQSILALHVDRIVVLSDGPDDWAEGHTIGM